MATTLFLASSFSMAEMILSDPFWRALKYEKTARPILLSFSLKLSSRTRLKHVNRSSKHIRKIHLLLLPSLPRITFFKHMLGMEWFIVLLSKKPKTHEFHAMWKLNGNPNSRPCDNYNSYPVSHTCHFNCIISYDEREILYNRQMKAFLDKFIFSAQLFHWKYGVFLAVAFLSRQVSFRRI